MPATEVTTPAAAAAARAAGQAVATCHMGAHALGAAAYAVRAVSLAAPDWPKVVENEIRLASRLRLDEDAHMLGNRMRSRSGSVTAAGVASMRAEMDRPVSPEGDAHVGQLLAETVTVRFQPRHLPILRPYIEGRTRYFDQAVAAAVRQCRQIVIIGAGYDDRAWRFRTAGVQFIEIDHPSTQRQKRAGLEACGVDTSDIRFVSADLAQGQIEVALEKVIDPELDTTFVCEAVVPYLRYERVRALLAGLALTSPKGATLYLDAPVRPDLPLARVLLGLLRLSTAAVGERIHSILTGSEMESLLDETGWREDVRTTGRDLGMPRIVADSRYLRLSRIWAG